MSRRDTVIKLGRSRSPARLRSRDGEASRFRMASEASSRDNAPQNENSTMMNRSMYSPSQDRAERHDMVMMANSMHPIPV